MLFIEVTQDLGLALALSDQVSHHLAEQAVELPNDPVDFEADNFFRGTAQAFRLLVGHLAVRAGVATFVPDYRLAPEHPFPAAVLDVQACFEGLAERGFQRIALTGDSAGGCLALVLLSITAARVSVGGLVPVAAAVLSPVTDLTLGGASWQTRIDVWEGMPHGFVAGVGRMHAATQALDAIGAFLAHQLSH